MGRNPRDIGACSVEEIAEVLAAHKPDTAPSEQAERHAAVAMILREGASGLVETLFILRAEHPGDRWSGQMALPGGRRDPGDATLEDVARRETLEEVGIELAPEMRVGRLNDVSGGRLKPFNLSVSPFVFHHPNPGQVTLNHEATASVWVPLAHFGDVRNVVPYSFSLDPAGPSFASFQYEGFTIWGLTFRIIGSLVQLFGIELPEGPRFSD